MDQPNRYKVIPPPHAGYSSFQHMGILGVYAACKTILSILNRKTVFSIGSAMKIFDAILDIFFMIITVALSMGFVLAYGLR